MQGCCSISSDTPLGKALLVNFAPKVCFVAVDRFSGYSKVKVQLDQNMHAVCVVTDPDCFKCQVASSRACNSN